MLGAIVCLICAFGLVRRGARIGGKRRGAPLAIFAGASALTMLASAVFHAMPPETGARAVTQRVDHAMIFVLIAATFTPVHAVLFRGWPRWGPLAAIWLAAAAGIALKAVFFTSVPEWLGVVIYLAMGWAGLASMIAVLRRRGWRFCIPFFVAASSYTIGAVIEVTNALVLFPGVAGPHEVFHVFVLGGVAAFWWLMRRIAVEPHAATALGSETTAAAA
jgi:channel protein (hemolysin III family)